MEQPYLGFYCRKKLILFFTSPDTEFYPLHENYNNFQLFKTPGPKNPYNRVLLGIITWHN